MGAAPPVEIAATRGERSRIEGRMNEQRTPVDGVDRNAPLPRGGCDGAGEHVVLGRDDDELHAVQISVAECAPVPCDPGVRGQLAQPRRDGGRDDDNPRSGAQQETGLGLRRLRAADDQAGLVPNGEENGQVVHGTACLVVNVVTGHQFERPQCVRSSAMQGAANRACESISPGRWAPFPRCNRRTLTPCRRDRLAIATGRAAWQARAGRGPMFGSRSGDGESRTASVRMERGGPR